MDDLFSSPPPTSQSQTYTAKDIEVLEGLEPVRRRPGMYIGGTDSDALHHMAAEIIDNAMDEVVADYATRITVELTAQGALKIQDNGRGIPVDPHPKYPDKSALEVILTTLHSGGKFSDKAYQTAGGLHGVGLSVVNALSSSLIVEVAREKTLWCQTYERGIPVSPLENRGPSGSRQGTSILFMRDPEIFGSLLHFSPSRLFRMLKTKAYLHKGVEIRWICDPSLLEEGHPTPRKATLHFPHGLADLLQELCHEREKVQSPALTGQTAFKDRLGKVEWAVCWVDEETPPFYSHCNTIPTPLGGTHVAGFRQALAKSMKAHAELVGNKKAAALSTDDCLQGLMGVFSVFIKNPHFQGQTKEKLVTQDVTRQVEGAIRDLFDHWFSENAEATSLLLEYLVEKAEEKKRLKQLKEVSRQSATKRLRLPGKLADCSSTVLAETEIFIVEGDSAGGSAKQARNRKTQAVLPLRGKILNVANASTDKLLGNQQLLDLAQALGCHLGPGCKVTDLRYGKIILMTDADVDGAHIASLLITCFFQKMRPLLEKGHVYLAQPPLYRLTSGTKSVYAKDDAHKEVLLKTYFSKKAKVEVSRFKGLGEMPWVQLRDTTMAPQNRSLLRVCLPSSVLRDLDQGGESPSEPPLETLTRFVDDLMGRNPEKRYDYIQKNARFVKELDI